MVNQEVNEELNIQEFNFDVHQQRNRYETRLQQPNSFVQQQQEGFILHKTNRRKNPWGNESYADLISKAISSNVDQKLTLQGIYDWLMENISFFASRSSENDSKSWKNSIRHNLSLHGRFKRVANSGYNRGAYWTLNKDPNTMNKKKCPKRPSSNHEDAHFFGKKRGRPSTTKAEFVSDNNQPVRKFNQINDSEKNNSLADDNMMQPTISACPFPDEQPVPRFEVPQYGCCYSSSYGTQDPTFSCNECRNAQLAVPSVKSGVPQAAAIRPILGSSIQPQSSIPFDITQQINMAYHPQYIEPEDKTMGLLNERFHPTTTLIDELAVPHESNNEEYFPNNDDVCVMDDGSMWRLVSHTSTRPRFKEE